MMHNTLLILLGVLLGWITKVPFLIKWYRELRATRNWERMDLERRVHSAKEKYPESFVKP